MSSAAAHCSACCRARATDTASSSVSSRSLPARCAIPAYAVLFAFRSYLKWMPASREPSAFCGRYATSIFANARLTVSALSPSLPSASSTAVTITSFILMTRNSCCPLPALRCVIVASFRCTPVAHACINTGDALSILWVKERSAKRALPWPAPVPATVTSFVTPQDQLRTSISPLCFSSSDSPLMSPSFAKMSAATPPASSTVGGLTSSLLGGRPQRGVGLLEQTQTDEGDPDEEDHGAGTGRGAVPDQRENGVRGDQRRDGQQSRDPGVSPDRVPAERKSKNDRRQERQRPGESGFDLVGPRVPRDVVTGRVDSPAVQMEDAVEEGRYPCGDERSGADAADDVRAEGTPQAKP